MKLNHDETLTNIAFNVILRPYMMVYVCTLPFILVHEVGVWGVVPTTMLLSLALFGRA